MILKDIFLVKAITAYIKNKQSPLPNNPYRRRAKKSEGRVLSCISLTNLRAVSGGSPVPVVDTTITRGAVSVFRSYYKQGDQIRTQDCTNL